MSQILELCTQNDFNPPMLEHREVYIAIEGGHISNRAFAILYAYPSSTFTAWGGLGDLAVGG